MLRSKHFLPGLALVLASGAFAQGDDCSSATAIGTTGTFAFDTTALTTSTFDGGGTCAVAASTINQDAFWQWTAPAAGDYHFDTLGSSFDTKMSVHAGVGCSATCSDYNDDFIALQSQVTMNGLAVGDMVLIQVGGFGVASGVGTLNITAFSDPCTSSADDALEDNDDCATANAMTDGTSTALFVSKSDHDHYAFCVADGDTVVIDLLFATSSGDVDGFLRDAASLECGNGNGSEELADGFSTSDNESIIWTNTTGADLDVVLEVNVWTGSTIDCNTYDLVISGSGGCGSANAGIVFCGPANNNSTGAPAVLTGNWGSGVGSDLHLEITSGVPGELVYLLAGNESTAGMPISNGQFCLIGTATAQFFRFNVAGTDMNSMGGFDATGTMLNAAGTSATGFGFDVPSTLPAGVPIPVLAGDTWHFQGWYKDTPAGIGTSNFTNGLSVTF